MTILIKISGKTEKENVDTPGLIDSRAGGKFIDQNYARKSGFRIQQLEQPLKAFNIDGTETNVELSKVLWILTLLSLEKEETPNYLLLDSENKRSSSDSHG